MRRVWAPVAACFLTALVGAGCGGGGEARSPDGGGGGEPVAITEDNLEGYWLADGAEVPQWRPMLLHFGPANVSPEEAIAGLPVVESSGVELGTRIGPLLLEADGTFELQRASPTGFGTYAYGKIEALTTSSLVIQFTTGRSDRVTFRRVDGCGGPGLWFGPSELQVVDAAWGPDGALHMMGVFSAELGDKSGYYHYIPPGRCAPYVPPVSIVGDSVDVSADGTIRIVQVDKETPTETGGVTLVKIERAPWNRPELDPEITVLTTERSTSAVRPASRTLARADGRTVALWADGDTLHAWEEQAGGDFTHSERPLLHGAKLTPQFLDVQPGDQGDFIVRGDRQNRGLRYRDGVWTEWTPAAHPELGQATVFAYAPNGVLHAAWGRKRTVDTRVPVVVVGRQRGDGGWDTVEAGLGAPQAMHVLDDGTIDVIATWEADRGPMSWIRVGPDLLPDTWRQAYTLHEQGSPEFVTTYTADVNVFPQARFGPDGEVLLGGYNLRWRRPALEGDGQFAALSVPVRFASETDATLVFPTLGLECREDCTLMLPPREVIPARLEAPPGSTRLVLNGNTASVSPGALGPSWAVIAQPALVAGGEVQLEVRGEVQRVFVEPLGDASSSSEVLGSDVDAQGHTFTVWRDGDGLATLARYDAGLNLADSRPLTGLSLLSATEVVGARGVIRALDAGGAVIYVDAYPGKGRALVFVDASLAEVHVQALDPFPHVALTADGAWESRPAIGGKVGLVHHTLAGSSAPIQTDLIEVNELLAVGDGVVTVSIGARTARPVLSRFRPDGSSPWTMDVAGGGSPELLWTSAGDDLHLVARYSGQLILGQTTLKAVSQTTIATVLLRGDSGAVVRQRVGGVGTPGMPSAAAIDADGTAMLWAAATFVRFEYVPWVEGASAAAIVDFPADVVPGFCAGPGTPCPPSSGTISARPTGGFGAAWTQVQPVDYDGLRVDVTGKRGVIGHFVPEP